MKQRATTSHKPRDITPINIAPRVSGKSRTDIQRLTMFLHEYIKDQDARAAGRRAGFSEKWCKQYSYQHLKNNQPYLAWLGTQVAHEAAKQIAIELDPVLQEIAKIAFANEWDYLLPVVKQAGDGTSTTTMRRKRLDELTKDQMIAIRVFRRPSGKLDYALRNKEGRLVDLGKHLGAWNEKLILEHRHAHLHAHLDLSKVPIDQLTSLEAQLEQMMGRHAVVRG